MRRGERSGTERLAPAAAVDPRLLGSFVVLAEELHFGRAADRLHVAQPAVSQQLQRLETQLGVRLVERSPHHVALTPAGERVLPYAQQAVAAAVAVQRVAAEAAGDRPTTLRVGVSPGAHYLVERALADFTGAAPQVRVQAVTDSSGALTRHVSTGDAEVAVGFEATAMVGVDVERLAGVPAVVAVGEHHRLAGRPSLALRDLAGETFALVDPIDGPGYNEAVRRLCRSAGYEPRTATAHRGPMAWETSVRSGGCVGLTSRISAASTLRGIPIVALEDEASFRIDLITPAAAEALSPAATAFTEVLRRRLEQVPLARAA